MVNIALVDDNEKYIAEIKCMISKTIKKIQYQLTKYTDEYNFIADIEAGIKYDIIFLDIMLNELNGIDIGQAINEKCPDTNIIFISANSAFYEDVYTVKHSYFLIKPFDFKRFEDAINKSIENIENKYLVFYVKSSKNKMFFDDILFLEGFLKKTIIHFFDGKIIEYPIRLFEIEGKLPTNRFVRTHQSFIVNLDRHINAERVKIDFPYEKVVPISRKYINEVKYKLSLYLGGAL